ncbi:hypothetical protein ILYODFUR_024476 [Ilyodon furcidens]|uniref:Uncharacterized protein n=1 Tax=Ilyodon furcidens TaxID=33524 RepID=A0ABV0TAY1_9TELE
MYSTSAGLLSAAVCVPVSNPPVRTEKASYSVFPSEVTKLDCLPLFLHPSSSQSRLVFSAACFADFRSDMAQWTYCVSGILMLCWFKIRTVLAVLQQPRVTEQVQSSKGSFLLLSHTGLSSIH